MASSSRMTTPAKGASTIDWTGLERVLEASDVLKIPMATGGPEYRPMIMATLKVRRSVSRLLVLLGSQPA